MKKYVKINPDKSCIVFIGSDIDWALQQGFVEQEVEEDKRGKTWLAGFMPSEISECYQELRKVEYPSIPDQLDMIYWDKVNGTNLWQEKIAEIKAKYPKE